MKQTTPRRETTTPLSILNNPACPEGVRAKDLATQLAALIDEEGHIPITCTVYIHHIQLLTLARKAHYNGQTIGEAVSEFLADGEETIQDFQNELPKEEGS